MNTPPILLIVFNRPNHTSKVFEAIRQARPSKLYIACDGPRSNNTNDRSLIDETIKIVREIDWSCTSKEMVRNENLGCKRAVSEAITWFFEQEEYGMILEDDCLPHLSFFNYCHQLLLTYATDERIMHVTGTNLQNGNIRGDGSYYFSKICHVWGWASWRRAWAKYDLKMETYPKFKKEKHLRTLFSRDKYLNYWYREFDKTYDGKIDTWDYQWVYTIWSNNGLCINPQVNLISNIGFDRTATHTTDNKSIYSNREIYPFTIDRSPTFIVQDVSADIFSMKMFMGKPSFKKRIENKIYKIAERFKVLFTIS